MKKIIPNLTYIPQEIDKPIVSYPYSEKFRTSLYRMHKYWGRKPSNVIATYIERYCPPHGIVLDPFLGSGTTAFEAIKLKRKVIGFDVNPLSIFITKTTLSPVRLALLEASFYTLYDEVVSHISPWYRTKCGNCGRIAFISYITHQLENHSDFSKERPLQIYYKCTCSPKTLFKDPDKEDIRLLEMSREINIEDWYPKDLSLPKIRPKAGEAQTIEDLYTKRNLYSLSKIHSAILNNPAGIVRDCLLLAFSSALPQCSRLSGVDKRKKDYVSAMGWILPSFRIMKQHVEKNPLEVFNLAFKRILKGKTESNNVFRDYYEATTANDIFNGRATAFISKASVYDLNDILNGNRVDYVLTDPPHGPSIQYMKLSSISNAWLRLSTDLSQDITQETSSKSSKHEYEGNMIQAFRNIRKVMSDNAKVHLYFRGKKEDWLNAYSTIAKGGFSFVSSVFQPQRYSFRTTFRGRVGKSFDTSPPGDWILQLRRDLPTTEDDLNYNDIEDIILKEAEDILQLRGPKTRFKYVITHIVSKIPSSVLRDKPELIIETLNKYVGIIFIKERTETTSDILNELWSLNVPSKRDISLKEKVKKAAIKALIGRDEIGSTRPYLYQAIYSSLPGKLTPDQSTIENVLEEIAEERDGKKYFLKDKYVKKRELHSELILALLKIGIENDFQVYSSPKAIERLNESDLQEEWKKTFNDNRNNIIDIDKLPTRNKIVQHSNVTF